MPMESLISTLGLLSEHLLSYSPWVWSLPGMYTGNRCSSSPQLPTGTMVTSMLSAPGTQNPYDLKIAYNSLMVLLSSRLTGPCPGGARGLLTVGGERLFMFKNQFVQGRSLLIPPLEFLKQEWQVIRAGVVSIPTVQLIALVTGNQGGNH